MTGINKAEMDRILADPSACFKHPDDVVHDKRLTHQQKVTVLKLWAFDEQEMEIAEQENMRSDNGLGMHVTLDDVLLALHQIERKKAA